MVSKVSARQRDEIARHILFAQRAITACANLASETLDSGIRERATRYEAVWRDNLARRQAELADAERQALKESA